MDSNNTVTNVTSNNNNNITGTTGATAAPAKASVDPATLLTPLPEAVGIPVPGPQTLRDVPRRVFTFILAVDRIASVGRELRKHGYSAADHEEGWRLLHKAGSHLDQAGASSSEAAMRELDAWDEIGFHKAHAALIVDYPSQADFVFKELVPHQGIEAVLGVVQFLDRLDILASGGRGDATRDDDAAAIEELGRRGVGSSERARLRALVDLAQSSPATLVDEPEALMANDRSQDLYALYCWYQRWVEIARAVIKNRKDAVALGIAHRRSRTATEVGAPIATQPPPFGVSPAPSPAMGAVDASTGAAPALQSLPRSA